MHELVSFHLVDVHFYLVDVHCCCLCFHYCQVVISSSKCFLLMCCFEDRPYRWAACEKHLGPPLQFAVTAFSSGM